jgi:formate dehydrogenase (NADP+) beta subunit
LGSPSTHSRHETSVRARIPERDESRGLVPCREACPVKTDAGAYVQAIAHGDFEHAYRIARRPNPLASICGRICGAPCEVACRRGELDSPISIRALKRAALEHSEYNQATVDVIKNLVTRAQDRQLLDLGIGSDALSNTVSREAAIAIIGSGPAGLSCAHDLALLGYRPVIFEMEPVAAGMLSVGIPAYRLPRELIEREVEFIRSLGVEIRCNSEVGRDIEFQNLLQEFDHVVVAVGAKKSRTLGLEGADGPGVLGGVEFLRDVNLDQPIRLGNRVVVIGGGNVAFDVARSAVRALLRKMRLDVTRLAAQQGDVQSVRLVCLEQRAEMPADEIEVIEGTEEGVELSAGYGPEAVLRDSKGRVIGLRCRKVKSIYDNEGRFAPKYDDARDVFPAETVICAIGQQVAVDFLRDVEGLELKDNGSPVVLHENKTTHSRIWVAGDLAYGTKLAIHAVASGRNAARLLHQDITGLDIRPDTTDVCTPLPNYRRERDYEIRIRHSLPVLPPEQRIEKHDLVVERETTKLWAKYEASRCLKCSVHTFLDPDKCILCGGCVDICPVSCLKLAPLGALDCDKEIDLPLDILESTSVLVKDETICIRCGLCAHRCPTDALTMKMHTVEAMP